MSADVRVVEEKPRYVVSCSVCGPLAVHVVREAADAAAQRHESTHMEGSYGDVVRESFEAAERTATTPGVKAAARRAAEKAGGL